MNLEMLFGLVGGLGLFIFGMRTMGDGLQKAAGDRLKRILEVLTSNPIMGVIVGAGITALVQSSSATTVMVVGFVNAGLMSLSQAVVVIMGANIGTTFTAQLIAFKLTDYALPAIAIGVFISLVAKKRLHRNIAQVLVGFGMLFLGMSVMTNAMKPLKEIPAFTELMVTLSHHPLMGVLTGMGLTAAIQSSSATIGILQGLASQGLVDIRVALPILFGDNIGTCVTALLSSIGTSIAARRAAIIHFLFNSVGTVVFMFLMPVVLRVVLWTSSDPVREIANAHTLFNTANTVIQLPFAYLLVAAATRIIRGEDPILETAPKYLDRRLLSSPAIALQQVVKELGRMGQFALDTLSGAMEVFFTGNERLVRPTRAKEEAVNNLEKEITVYLVELAQRSLTKAQSERLNFLYNAVNDIERVGDHAMNILELAEYKMEHDLPYSDEAIKSLKEMYEMVMGAFAKSLASLTEDDPSRAGEVIITEDDIDALEKAMRRAHIKRLNEGRCYPGSGVVFLDVISNLERIGDHASGLSHGVMEEVG